MYYTRTDRDGHPCPLQKSCMAMHGVHMEAQPQVRVGHKGESGEGDVQSYQVPSKGRFLDW